MISAFANVHSKIPEFKLVLAGEAISAEYKNKLINLIKTLKLEHKIIFLGAVENSIAIMREATALIMASKAEGLGRVTIEAMSQGCLVIGYNKKGTKEQFDNGLEITGHEIGIRYETQRDLEEIMINVAHTNIEHYSEMIKQAQFVVSQLYLLDTCVKNIQGLYSQILNENKK